MLVYLLLADRDVEIVADRGIHAPGRRRRVGSRVPEHGGGVSRRRRIRGRRSSCAASRGDQRAARRGTSREPRRRANELPGRARCFATLNPGYDSRACPRARAGLDGLDADEVQRIAARLVHPVADQHQHHRAGHEHAEQDDRRIDAETLIRDHQRVEPDHHENADVLVEVLHGDRMSGAHQHVAAMLQQRVHRHDEEARAGADQDHEHDDQRQRT